MEIQLTVKELAPYLDSKLGLEITNAADSRKGETVTMKGLHFTQKERLTIQTDNSSFYHWEVKPLMLPLSCLTEEITVDGETFVPIVQLLKHFSLWDLSGCEFEAVYIKEQNLWYANAVKDRVIDSVCYDGNTFQYMVGDGTRFEPVNPHSEAMKLMHKWHFDLHGLIDAGLAIDKRKHLKP